MEDLQDKMSKAMTEALKSSENNFIEFLNSEVHDCPEKKDDRIIFFVSPEGKLKYTLNQTSVLGGFGYGSEVKCCFWCGFKVKD